MLICIMKAILLPLTVLMLGTVFTTNRGLTYAQTGTTSGNVTAQITPQGTSLNTLNKATPAGNENGTTSGNVTAQITPQGTSLNTLNKATPAGNENGTTSGNVTAQITPQGTSLNTNSSRPGQTTKP
jgi:hypothetical protein